MPGCAPCCIPAARETAPDVAAFIYSLLRLPACINTVQLVVLGQSTEVFAHHGYDDLESWEPVSAVARRRRCFYNQRDTLACFIASRSDIDDVIPILTAFQIEWNKIHYLFKGFLSANPGFHFACSGDRCKCPPADWRRRSRFRWKIWNGCRWCGGIASRRISSGWQPARALCVCAC